MWAYMFSIYSKRVRIILLEYNYKDHQDIQDIHIGYIVYSVKIENLS